MEGPGNRHAREFESNLPKQNKRRAVKTGGAAPREEPLDGTVSGDGPPEVDVSAAAAAYVQLYYCATSGAEQDEQRVMAARFEVLEVFKQRGAYAKLPVNEALGKTGKRPIPAQWADAN